jgi:hypothetical protein
MDKRRFKPIHFKLIDFVPALSGLIGKTALVTSFAVVWATQFNITNPSFVFENVRIEMIIGSIITLVTALLLPNTAPSGTLAPLIVLVPAMAAFGVHPFLLSILVGIIGILGIKTKLFHKLVTLSGLVSKTSLTLTIGISGVLLSIKNLLSFFGERLLPLFIIIVSLSVVYFLLGRLNKLWLIVPVAAGISFIVSIAAGINLGKMDAFILPYFNPSYWWKEMWGIGFGFEFLTILKTIPFAFFVLLLWAIDTISITAMLEANYLPHEKKEEINLEHSFIITSLRNILGGVFGGAQTSALWRSFLIPLFMMKRPLRPASILLGIFGIAAGFTAYPIIVLSFPPLIWSVLLFGIFLPFVVVGYRNLRSTKKWMDKIVILIAAVFGILISPMITWVGAMLFETIDKVIQRNNKHER